MVARGPGRLALALALLIAAPAPAAPTATPSDAPAPPAADADPWDPATWLPATPVLYAVRWQPHTATATLLLDFGPGVDAAELATATLTAPAANRLDLTLPGAALALTDLPPPRDPVTTLDVTSTQGGPTLTLTLAGPTPASLERDPTGWRLHLGAARHRPADPLADIDPRTWVAPADAAPALAAAHHAADAARAGRGPEALSALFATLDAQAGPGEAPPAPLPPAIRAALDLQIAHLTHREGLHLIALGAAARALRRAIDDATRADAFDLMLRVDAAHPGALALIAPDVALELAERAADPITLATGRALLRLDDPYTAAELLRLAHRHRPHRDRARYLAHVAARLGGDRAAADAHLDALAATPDPRLRAHVTVARARRAYEDARPADADAHYASARVTDDPALTEAITVERGWLALRRGDALALLPRLLPLDLATHGAPRALLVGAIYHRLCHPARAAALATALIERHALDPIGRQFAYERATLSYPRWAPLRDRLVRHLDAHRDRYDTLLALDPSAFYHRRARRLRIGADARATGEALEQMRRDRDPPPPEPPLPVWQGTVWAEADAIGDRCAQLGLTPPIGAAADVAEMSGEDDR